VMLTNAAFIEAVDRTFTSGTTTDDIIQFVANVRGHGRKKSGLRWIPG
jgi:hypothetical protein